MAGRLCGALIVVPLAIAWLPPPPRAWFNGRLLELALSLAALVGLTVLGWQTGHPMSFLALPALTWAALRFGPRGATAKVAAAIARASANNAGPEDERAVTVTDRKLPPR